MGNRGPNKRGVETRRKLLSAGLSEFHANGFTATGVDVIAKSAGVPKGSFYNFFDTKNDFAAEVVDLYFERHRAKLLTFLENRELSPLARLRAYFDERVAFFTSIGFQRGCMMGNLSAETTDHSEVMRERLAENFDSWSELFAETIREAQAIGEVKETVDAEILANFVLNSWEGSILRMRTVRSAKPLVEAKALIFNTVLVS
jgi:TetR/AcrR family transcriptional regulator, transcriptional repressor for nem operon